MGGITGKVLLICLSGFLHLCASVSTESDKPGIVSLFFYDTVLINDTMISLGNIANIKTPDDSLKTKLQLFIAGNAAPAGYSRYLNTDDLILYRLKSEFDNVQFIRSGPDRILVRTDFVEKRVGDFHVLIQDYFEKNVLWAEKSWQLSLLEPQRSWKCLSDSILVEVNGLENGYPKGNIQVYLKVRQGHKSIRIPVACNVKVTIPVLVAKNSIIRGQLVTSQDCELRNVDITRFAPQPLFDLNALEGMRAVRTIAPGTIIHNRLIQAVPAVEKGDPVEIIVSKGRVKVAVLGIAREAGKMGERIWVENSVSKKLIQTIITNKGKVTVAQGGFNI